MQEFTGGQILVKTLQAHGVKRAFGVAGESYLAVLDALYDAPDIHLVTNRQEGAAAFMAEAYGKLTGETGICFVTRGPGATNASIGIHTAKQDSTPMILFVGQVARDQMGREAFQEIDYRDMFKPPISKAVFEIMTADEIAEIVAKAFQIANVGRKGPVVVSLPEDILTELSDKITFELKAQESAPPLDMSALTAALDSAERPVFVIGGSGWHDQTCARFQNWAEAQNIPVVTSFRRQDLFDHNSAVYAGELGTGVNLELVRCIKEDADLVVLLNTRLGEMASQGYSLLNIPAPQMKTVHVYPDAHELGKVYASDIQITADINNFVEILTATKVDVDVSEWTEKLTHIYKSWSHISKTENAFDVDMDFIFKTIQDKTTENTIITTDAGNFSGWAQRYLKYGRGCRLLAPTSGAMGYGAPSAISAAITMPDKQVIGLMGDGGFMMTGQCLATAMAQNAAPVILIFNNGVYGTIRMHQARDYPNRQIATDLHNPDFVRLAESYGAKAFKVQTTSEFDEIFEAALRSDILTVIEIVTNPEQITTTKRLSDIESA